MIQLVGNNVAIEPMFDPDISTGGLYIPEMAKERCDQGIVKYIGPKCYFAKPLMHVLFSGYSGTYIEVQDEGRLIMMPENFLMLAIEAETTEIPGVYFKGANGVYFPATYEHVTGLIAEAFRESAWFRNMKDINVSSATTKDKAHYGRSERYTFTGHTDSQLDPSKDPTDPDEPDHPSNRVMPSA